MEARYIRNIPALTEEECRILQKKKVLVAGCGGLGGHIIELLTRIGIGTIRAVDGDVFEPSNLNRQLYSEMSLLGSSKVQAAAQRVARINPDVHLEAIHGSITPDNAREVICGCDAVLDGLDNSQSRKLLSEACAAECIPYIYGAIQGWVAQAAVSMPGDQLLRKLYPREIPAEDAGVLSFTPALCAAVQCALCVKLLTGRPVQTGRVYYFDLLNQEFDVIPMA